MRCAFTRWRLSHRLDSGAALPGHVARCASCRDFAARLDALHDRLILDAAIAPRPTLSRKRSRVPQFAAAGLAAAIAATIIAVWSPSRPVAPAHSAAVAATQPTKAVGHATEQRIALATKWIESPLTHEIKALEADTSRGTRAMLGAVFALGR